MIAELSSVVLTHDIEEYHLRAGDVGTVVLAHKAGAEYEVEFITLGGTTVAVLTLPSESLRLARADEIAHVRQVA